MRDTDNIPTYLDLMNPTLSALQFLGGSASIKEIVAQVIDEVRLSSVSEIPHGRGSQTELEYRLAWSRTYLKAYGLINNSERGIWSLATSPGAVVQVDPEVVRRHYFRQKRDDKEDGSVSASLINDTEVSMDDSSDEIPVWRETLISTLNEMTPDAFERLGMRLLRESGFIEVEVTGRPGDGGIDGNGIIRVAGLISFPVLFQCKRYSGSVGAGSVRDFRGAMVGRADKGLILTTGNFTREAYREATRDGAPPIDLIDGELLIDRLKELGLGVKTKMVEVVEVDAEWFDSI